MSKGPIIPQLEPGGQLWHKKTGGSPSATPSQPYAPPQPDTGNLPRVVPMVKK